MNTCQHTAPAVTGERSVLIDVRTPKARKVHSCDECNRFILKGEQYRREILKYGMKLFHHKYCEDCLSVREVLFSSGWYYGHLWNQVYDFVVNSKGRVSEYQLSCLAKPARDKICDMIERTWYED